jgi:hypothetical protein
MKTRGLGYIIIAVTIGLLLPSNAVAQQRFGIHLFGVSYHYQSRTYTDASGETKKYQQLNFGAGFQYVISEGQRNILTADAGVYRDSKDRANVFGGLVWRFKITPWLAAGVGVVALTSPTYAVPVAPLPVLTWKVMKEASVNAAWIPSLGNGESGSITVFATLHFGHR